MKSWYIIIFLLTILVSVGMYFQSNQKMQEKLDGTVSDLATIEYDGVDTKDSSSETIDNNVEWKTYVNDEHGFSLRYPCDDDCQASPEQGIEHIPDGRINIPTLNEDISIDISFLSNTIIGQNEKALEQFEFDGFGSFVFPFSLDDMSEALSLPVGSEYVFLYPSGTKSGLSSRIIVFGEKKAIQQTRPESISHATTFARSAFYRETYVLIDNLENIWLTLKERADVLPTAPDDPLVFATQENIDYFISISDPVLSSFQLSE